MTDDNTEERDSFIAGLRDLADFLEQENAVPAPRWASAMFFSAVSTDDEQRREIDRIAALIGGDAEDRTAKHGHYTTSRDFGPVQYRAVAIPASSAAYHAARLSYSGNIVPAAGGEA
jgi:hypothetical protein